MAEEQIFGISEDETPVAGRLRLLHVHVIEGVQLAKKDIFGASDPYVNIILHEGNKDESMVDSTKTKTKKKTLNPVWDEQFTFRVNQCRNFLLFEVFDENRVTRDDFLGQVEIPLQHFSIHIEEPNVEVLPIPFLLRPRSAKSRVKGHLSLKLTYLPDDQGDSVITVQPSSPPEEGWDLVNTETAETAEAAEEVQDQEPGENGAAGGERGSISSLPLPVGWEERVDEQGRRFFVNHVQQSTQWERPQDDAALGDLSSNLEERTDAEGRTLYFDHRYQQVRRSPSARAAESEETLLQQQQMAANNFRTRRHISQEDTLNFGSCSTISGTESDALPVRGMLRLGNRADTVDAGTSIPVNANDEPMPPGWAMSVAPNSKVFFIDHNRHITTWEDPRKRQRRTSAVLEVPNSSQLHRTSSNEDLTRNLGPLPSGWEERLHGDGRIFYIDHNTHQTQWEDPRLQKLSGPAVKYSRDYKRKYDYFRSKLRKPNNAPIKFDIRVSRKNILEDSYRVLMSVKSADDLKARLWIEFSGEHGLDYGGVAREWFYLLSRVMFNPYYCLFEYSAIDDYTLQINPLSGLANEEHLSYFKFIGRVVGMAVYHGKLIDGYFIRPFYKMMLGKAIGIEDMESANPEYYNSMKWILENDPECLELTFSVDEEVFGETKEVELVENGKCIPVTQENKREYINLIVKWRFVDRVKLQMESFMAGFNELVPAILLSIFDENEIELLLAGLQDIDIGDWKRNTIYRGEYNSNHPVIVNFWMAVYSFNMETRSRLLQFATGTSRVPMNGFAELYGSNGPQKFTIEKWGTHKQLPRAHTCFNRIDLPSYSTYQQLRRKVLQAIDNSEGFDGVD